MPRTVKQDPITDRLAAWLRSLVLLVCALIATAIATDATRRPARADAAESAVPQAVASDIPEQTEGAVIPAPPADFTRERVGLVQWDYHPQNEGQVRALQSKVPDLWQGIGEDLGVATSPQLTIRIARSPAELNRLAPLGSPPPSYAVGVAYPALGLILLSTVAPDTWLPPDLPSVLTHELSHVALHRAVAGRSLPLWFIEGLAVTQAGEQRLTRVRTLWEAALSDEIVPIEALDQRFPARPQQVNLAYAQSADMVQYLLKRPEDRRRLGELLGHVRAGESFETALLLTYHVDLHYLMREWRQSLGERFRLLPMVVTGSALWGGMALLAILAFVRRRKQLQVDRERLAAQEAEEDRLFAEASIRAQALVTVPANFQNEHPFPVGLTPPEPGIPTVEHDGQRHTLH